MNIEPDTLIVQAPEALAADVGTEIVIMGMDSGLYLALDPVGRAVWLRLAQPCSFAALCDGLSEVYEGDRATIEQDVRTLLGTLYEAKIVELRP